MAEQEAAQGKNTATSEDVPASRLLAHELVQFFMQKTHRIQLNKELIRLLTEAIRIPDNDGGMKVYQGGLIGQWDDVPGFSEFAKQRIPQYIAAMPASPHTNLLRNLRNLHKPGPQMPGFWEWRKQNPALCKIVAPAAPERKVVDAPPSLRHPKDVPSWELDFPNMITDVDWSLLESSER